MVNGIQSTSIFAAIGRKIVGAAVYAAAYLFCRDLFQKMTYLKTALERKNHEAARWGIDKGWALYQYIYDPKKLCERSNRVVAEYLTRQSKTESRPQCVIRSHPIYGPPRSKKDSRGNQRSPQEVKPGSGVYLLEPSTSEPQCVIESHDPRTNQQSPQEVKPGSRVYLLEPSKRMFP